MQEREPYPGFAGVNTEGPWDGVDAVAPGGLPRSPKAILAMAKEHGWGFGPITLVMRLNHPAKGVPPFFMSWAYNVDTGKWAYEGARALNRARPLKVADIRGHIENPETLRDIPAWDLPEQEESA